MDPKRHEGEWEKRQRALRYVSAGLIFFLSLFYFQNANAQELFPNTEPASTMPKKVLGFRQINEMYTDINDRSRYYAGFRFMYGVTKNLTVMSMLGASNHHFKKLPTNFVNYIVNHHRRAYPVNPFLLEGWHVYAKYRLLSFDGEQRHLRMAAYAEANKAFVAHTEAESNLMTDNTGAGGGLIVTRLYKRFAVSGTWGFIKIAPYTQRDERTEIIFRSGDVMLYNISFGYRVYPRKYEGYKDVNINLYAEFINKSYGAATITYNGLPYDYEYLKGNVMYTYNSFIANQYSELRSSVQLIFDSNSRLDIGLAVPVYKRSYIHDYPLVFINVQKYLFR